MIDLAKEVIETNIDFWGEGLLTIGFISIIVVFTVIVIMIFKSGKI